jgi:aminopeptidase N
MNLMCRVKLFLIVCCVSLNVYADVDFVAVNNVDFIHYKAELEANFKAQSVSGKVNIEFIPKVNNVNELTFSAKYKTIHSVQINNIATAHYIKDERLIVAFKEPLLINNSYTLRIKYQSLPKRGMKFYDDHLFTVYHTQNWLVSHNSIADKASFEVLLTHDAQLTSTSNGELISQQATSGNKVVSHWLQASPIPVYTFGFALGEFDEVNTTHKNSKLSYLYRKSPTSGLTTKKIKEIFVDVPDMIDFFEMKAGFALPNNSYQYVVVEGYMAQEAAGFSLVGEKFAHTVLEDKNENWFIAHELAHEWWGNSITCANFSHFWLNEGLVQFLVAAYKQHLFGEKAYKKEIGVAIVRVNRAVQKGKISPVAFKHQIKEQNINRTMTYSKGALIFYMLRNKLGDETFWQALKHYSVKNKQASVTTNDLKNAFEKISKQDLTPFFDRWVYGEEIPKLSL